MASIVTKREVLEAALVEAEAALAEALFEAIQIGADRNVVDAGVNKARSRCRHAHAALARFDRSEFQLGSDEPITAPFKEVGEALKLQPNAPTPSRHITERPRRKADKRQVDTKCDRRSDGSLGVRYYLWPVGAPAWRLLVRQAMMLLVLVLAYLQYDFMDVELQMALLPPSITVFSLS